MDIEVIQTNFWLNPTKGAHFDGEESNVITNLSDSLIEHLLQFQFSFISYILATHFQLKNLPNNCPHLESKCALQISHTAVLAKLWP